MGVFEGDIFNLAETARKVALEDPERTAVIEPEKIAGGRWKYRSFSYRELSEAAEALALSFRKLGIAERTRTVMMAPPSFEAAVALLALNRVGATLLLIDPSVGYRNVGERLRRVSPEAMVGLPLAHLGRLVFGWGPRLMRKAVSVGGSFPGTLRLRGLVEEGRRMREEESAPRITPESVGAVRSVESVEAVGAVEAVEAAGFIRKIGSVQSVGSVRSANSAGPLGSAGSPRSEGSGEVAGSSEAAGTDRVARKRAIRSDGAKGSHGSIGSDGADGSDGSDGSDGPKAPDITPDDVAAVLYTTGSTGPAKPTEYLHANYCAVHRSSHLGWGFHERDEIPVDLVAFPAFMSVALSFGGTCVVPPINFARQGPADVDPAAVIQVINDCRVRTFFASPALLERISEHAHNFDLRMPSLIRVIGGGAPMFPPLMRALLQVMGEGAEVCSNYGATEALPSTHLSSREVFSPDSGLLVPGRGVCVGRPFPDVQLRVVPVVEGIMERTHSSDELKDEELGELLVSGPNISPRYFSEPESTAKNKTFDESGQLWHRLGDVGFRDAQGRYWVAGRVGHRVKSAEGTLSPMHAETILDTHPAVRRSGLVGVPSGQGEKELPVACIELHQTAGSEEKERIRKELLELLRKHSHTRSIQHILFTRRLPVDPRHNAKIERPQLALWAKRHFEGRPAA